MGKEILIPHKDLEDPQTITARNIRMFKEHGLDIHRHEVEKLEDDFKKKVRRYTIKNTKYFLVKVPWK